MCSGFRYMNHILPGRLWKWIVTVVILSQNLWKSFTQWLQTSCFPLKQAFMKSKRESWEWIYSCEQLLISLLQSLIICFFNTKLKLGMEQLNWSTGARNCIRSWNELNGPTNSLSWSHTTAAHMDLNPWSGKHIVMVWVSHGAASNLAQSKMGG